MLLDVAEFVLAGVRKHQASLRGSKRHEPPARVPKDVLAKERKILQCGLTLVDVQYVQILSRLGASFCGGGLEPFACQLLLLRTAYTTKSLIASLYVGFSPLLLAIVDIREDAWYH